MIKEEIKNLERKNS